MDYKHVQGRLDVLRGFVNKDADPKGFYDRRKAADLVGQMEEGEPVGKRHMNFLNKYLASKGIDATAPPPVVGGPGASQPPAPTAFNPGQQTPNQQRATKLAGALQPSIHNRPTKLAPSLPGSPSPGRQLTVPPPLPTSGPPVAPSLGGGSAGGQLNVKVFQDLTDAVRELTRELKQRNTPTANKPAAGKTGSSGPGQKNIINPPNLPKSMRNSQLGGVILSAAMKGIQAVL